MKALRILLVVAVSMLFVVSAFAQEYEFKVEGEAEYAVEFSSSEVGDADAVTDINFSDGGKIKVYATATKELDNGATALAETRIDIKWDEFAKDYIRVKYMNGPLTVSMLKCDRPGIINKGLDKYIPEAAGDPGRYEAWVEERGVAFAYAGEGMTFTTTLDINGDNRIGVRPHVAMGLGGFNLEAAAEYVMIFPTDTDADGPKESNYGAGVALEATMGAIEFSVSGTYGMKTGQDAAGDDTADTTVMSAYAMMKMSVGSGTLGLAGGYNMESIDGVDDDATGMQFNFGYEQGNIIVPGLKLKVGAGYASATDHADVDSTKTGGNLKLVYEL
jgi:hypothetical protein